MPEINSVTVRQYLTTLQQQIVNELETFDGGSFVHDAWQHDQGTGLSCVIEDSHFFERGGVNFSHIQGTQLPAAASTRPDIPADRPFEAMGVSLVLHPRNPYCPTSHMNVRFFTTASDDAVSQWWFGGGMDLTPYYPFEEDVRHFHRTCRDAVTTFADEALYQHYKQWCDDYFYLPHRQEARGVGGIFFDDLNATQMQSFERAFALICSVGSAFTSAYLPIAEQRKDHPYGERERHFQALRRGRYAEFNLACDRGTLFGLQSGGRTESILMSMPPMVKWRYAWQPEPDSAETQLAHYLQPHDWI